MKNISGLLLFSLPCAPAIMAQSPRSSAIGPLISASLGNSYINLEVPSSKRIGLNGLDAAITINLVQRLGPRIDVGYVRASHVLNSGNHSDVLSYLAGLVFYPVRHRSQGVFVQVLLRGARETGAVPVSGGGFLKGYVNQLVWAIGTGAEFRANESIGLRVGSDYLHTAYFRSTPVITGQSNLRIIAVSPILLEDTEAKFIRQFAAEPAC